MHAGPFEIVPPGIPPVIGKLKISRDEISEDGDGKECNKTYAKVRVEKVTDEDGSVTSVALTWVIDDARRGIVPMELSGLGSSGDAISTARTES